LELNAVERNAELLGDGSLGRASPGEPILPPRIVRQLVVLVLLTRRQDAARNPPSLDCKAIWRGRSTDRSSERHAFLGLGTP
jgi:hypothetical protein